MIQSEINPQSKMTKKRARILLLTVLAAASLFLLLDKNFLPGLSPKLSSYKSFELLGKVIHLIKDSYIEEASPTQTMKGAYKGLVNSLDILSCYLDKESVLRYSHHKDTDLKDIGVILYKRYGFFPQVIGTIENSPAQREGIKIGDYISAIDNRSTQMMGLTETYLYIKDKEKSPVKIRILRGEKKRIE